MSKKETFVLDAVLKDVIHQSTFNAVLSNGHAFVAFPAREKREMAGARLQVGDTVRVEMSPFDMSRGMIVF